MRLIQKYRWFFLGVVLPVLLTAAYTCLVQSSVYVSEAHFVIKSATARPSQITSIANLVQTAGLSGGQEQANEVVAFMRSRSALKALNNHGEVAAAFGRSGTDSFSAYPGLLASRSEEALFRYYKDMVEAGLDHESGLVVLRVKSFDPTDAQKLNLRLLGLGEKLVNDLNEHARSRQVSEAEKRVTLAEERVRKARLALGAYRNQQTLLDPAKQASGVLDISAKLQTERATLQAQLGQMQSQAPRNPAIPSLKGRIAEMDKAIAAQESRAVGGAGAFAGKLPAYENLAEEQQFATQNLVAASASLESARAEAARQQYYLERVVEPNAPDLPTYPHRLRNIATVAGGLLCLYFVAWMFIVGILEHAPED
jgi:capsular polysaccharide transport system permease protein